MSHICPAADSADRTTLLAHATWNDVASMTTRLYSTDTPLTSTRQHPSYGQCQEVKREYCQNCSVLDCSQSAAHLYEYFLQVKQIGFVTLGPIYAVRRGGCLEL